VLFIPLEWVLRGLYLALSVCIETYVQTRNGIVYLPNHFYGFTGKNLCFYKNGQIKSRGKYENGKKVGVWTWWYENGQIKRGEYYE
jgi:antitoxin component YwqK of YwqJK toxin-antitoxin module